MYGENQGLDERTRALTWCKFRHNKIHVLTLKEHSLTNISVLFHSLELPISQCKFQHNKIHVLTLKEHSLTNMSVLFHRRTGLHSGPITAGVLRGSNSRFQLFIDTMASILCVHG